MISSFFPPIFVFQTWNVDSALSGYYRTMFTKLPGKYDPIEYPAMFIGLAVHFRRVILPMDKAIRILSPPFDSRRDDAECRWT